MFRMQSEIFQHGGYSPLPDLSTTDVVNTVETCKTESGQPCNRRDDIQVIRGLAIVCVVIFHFFPKAAPNGYLGVDQFFVISGFLMTFIFSSKPLSFESCGQFYYRRIKRILPLYWLNVFIGMILTYLLLPEGIFKVQLASARSAFFLVTNLVPVSEENKYFFMLESASDIFTHTWSLCVEMQFYLIVPVLFAVSNFCERITGNVGRFMFLFAIGLISFVYQTKAPASTAFNGTACRLWQFVIGITACNFSEYCSIKNFNVNKTIVRSLSFALILATMCVTYGPLKINDHIARWIVTGMTGLFIISCSLLPDGAPMNKAVVYIGNISFSCYLFHWPLNCLVKMWFPKDNIALAVGFVVSFLIAIFVFETFEKFYLSLEKKAIAFMLVLLFTIICAGIIYAKHKEQEKNDSLFDFDAAINQTSDKQEAKFLFDFDVTKNFTLEEAMQLNVEFDTDKFPLLEYPNCIPQNTQHLCKFENEVYGTLGSYRSLIIGNSYACNSAPLFNSHLSKVSNETYSYCRVGCVVLTLTPKCDTMYQDFFDVTQSLAPDILFITVRHMLAIDRSPIVGDVRDDSMVNAALERLRQYEQVVSKRIYILDSMPQVFAHYMKTLNQHLKDGTPYNASEFIDDLFDYKSGQERLKEIERRCEKCELFTYMDELIDENGEMMIVRDDNKLALWTNRVHLSPAGLYQVSPVYERITTTLANESNWSAQTELHSINNQTEPPTSTPHRLLQWISLLWG